MPVLPVTKTWSSGTFSRTRLSRFENVGAKCMQAIDEMSWRFSSSGNGVRLSPPVRSPASTCITGTRRWKAASAEAIAELVSPWTSTQAGALPASIASRFGSLVGMPNHSTKKSSKRLITEVTRSLSSRRPPAQRVTSVWIPARSKISWTIRWCWPVETTTGL